MARMRKPGSWLTVGVLLIVLWIVGWALLKVASLAIHLVLLVALVVLAVGVWQWVQRVWRRRVRGGSDPS